MDALALLCGHFAGDYLIQPRWMAAHKNSNTIVCLVHCFCYTGAVIGFSLSYTIMSTYAVAFIFWSHFFIDRFNLAVIWCAYTEWYSGEKFYDFTFHLICLWIAGRYL